MIYVHFSENENPWTNPLIGAGIGAAGLGLGNILIGDKKKSKLRRFIGGAVPGAAIGGLAGYAYDLHGSKKALQKTNKDLAASNARLSKENEDFRFRESDVKQDKIDIDNARKQLDNRAKQLEARQEQLDELSWSIDKNNAALIEENEKLRRGAQSQSAQTLDEVAKSLGFTDEEIAKGRNNKTLSIGIAKKLADLNEKLAAGKRDSQIAAAFRETGFLTPHEISMLPTLDEQMAANKRLENAIMFLRASGAIPVKAK